VITPLLLWVCGSVFGGLIGGFYVGYTFARARCPVCEARAARLAAPPTEDELMQDVLNLTARHGNLKITRMVKGEPS